MKKNFALLILLVAGFSSSAQLTATQIDSLVTATLKRFDVPGIAVGIVKDGNLIHAKGYGVRSLKNNLPVDENTLFGIASNSKAFTCMALAQLVDEKKLKWTDKVRSILPEFTMPDAYVAEEFNIKDLLVHRSGLGLGAGDLMFFPEGGNFTVTDIMKNLKHFKPESSFRTEFQYDNSLYIIAGEIIKRVSGLSWEEYIEQKLLTPLGMMNSKASYNRVPANANIIDAHVPINGKVEAIPHDWSELANPAGGIMSNVSDLSKWLIALMNNATLPNGKKMVSVEQLNDIWNIQTVIPTTRAAPYFSNFAGYGLGWFINDVNGQKQVGHTGGLLGTVTQITILPHLNLGIIVLTNQQQGVAFNTISNTIKDAYLKNEQRNWLKIYGERFDRNNTSYKNISDSIYKLVAAAQKSTTLNKKENILGQYNDAWFGKATIYEQNAKLRMNFERSPKLKGEVLPLNFNTYVVKWDDRSLDADAYFRSLDADAYLNFTFNTASKSVSFSMAPISPITDFSFDFQDLNYQRVD